MVNDMSSRTRSPRALLAALALLAPALGGCVTDVDATSAVYPSDLRERHPIVLVNGPRALDLFASGPTGLTAREQADLNAFLAEYRRYGDSVLAVQVPVGPDAGPGAGRVVAAVRAAAGGRISVSNYHPSVAGVASPVRLTFRRLQARVADRCGSWPHDLGVSDYHFSESNRPHFNFGCSLQANVAAQVADPLDLVRGRTETPPDTAKRMGAITKLRSGADPSTTYKQDGQNKISNAVGN